MNELHIKTVSGAIETLIFPKLTSSVKTLVMLITQGGVLAPVKGIVPFNNTLLNPDTLVFSYIGVGRYLVTLAEAFKKNDTSVSIGDVSTSDAIAKVIIIDGNSCEINIERAGVLVNDALNDTPFYINKFEAATPTVTEDIFNALLLLLDSNQLLLWDKIVVRNEGVVTEVSGSKYRKTGVYATSVKVIKS